MPFQKTGFRIPAEGDQAVVIGAGRSGVAVSRLLRSAGAKVTLLEKNPEALSEDQYCLLQREGIGIIYGDNKPEYFREASFVIPSPAIPILELREKLDNARAEIISEMEMAWRFLNNEPVIAITGTSGKTTCASLAASMLKRNNYNVFLGGNIGTPLSEYVLDGRKADALVLEVSSFQLQGCKTFAPRAAVLLNLSPNHLDYHRDMREYLQAKLRIFQSQEENDLAIIDSKLQGILKDYPLRAHKVWLEESGRFPESSLFGKHNAINAEAAWQAVKFFGVPERVAAEAVKNFAPLPHRLEKVGEVNNILFVNDSKSTTISSLEAAIRAFERPIHLLCGGKFKGGDLAAISGLIREKVRDISLFGGSREIFEGAWKNQVPTSWFPTLAEACRYAFSLAQPGDVVLLSPGTSSFDQYHNYKERGEDFKKVVEGIDAQVSGE